MTRLRSAFIGNETPLTMALCRWLADRTNLRLIIWTSPVPWPRRLHSACLRVGRRILAHRRRKGLWRTLDEFAYYGSYLVFLRAREERRIRPLTVALEGLCRSSIEGTPQVRSTDLRDPELWKLLSELGSDAIFATCTNVHFPREVLDAPHRGAFLWHEGITPEYRGVYPTFWALYREDYARIGYTLLKMNEKLDAGPVFVQGPVVGANYERDWHCYLSAKSIVDSLPHVDRFIRDLEAGRHQPLERPATDGYYSYPTATALVRLALRRRLRRARQVLPSRITKRFVRWMQIGTLTAGGCGRLTPHRATSSTENAEPVPAKAEGESGGDALGMPRDR